MSKRPYAWIDASELVRENQALRESLSIERGAYAYADRERWAFYRKLLAIRELLDAYEGREGARPRNPAAE